MRVSVMLGVGLTEEVTMRKVGLIVALLLLGTAHYGCGNEAVIARGGDFVLTPDDLRFEVLKLGPSFSFEDTFEGRKALVDVLVTRFLLSEEAEKRGYGEEDLANEVISAERGAVGEAYHKWKIDRAVRVPRIESKTVLAELDRKLHIKQMIFAVYPVAEEALRDMRAGETFEDLAASVADRQDITVRDEGWAFWKNFDRDVAFVLFQLHVGDVSDIVRGKQGYSIYYLVEDAPAGASPELINLRSKRFVRANREAALVAKERAELSRLHHVTYSDDGLSRALRAFAISFTGTRPPDSLLAVDLATYDNGGISSAYLFSYYYSLPPQSQPYVGDLTAIKEFALDTMLPSLEANAGYSLGLQRLRDVLLGAKKAREEFLIPKMEEFFGGQIVLSPDDRINYYNEHRNELATTGTYNARRILLDSQEKAKAVMRELRSGREFADVAREQSLDKYTAVNGGDLGNLQSGIIAAYDSVLADLRPGDITRPFKTAKGVEILKLEAVEASRSLSFEEAGPYIDGMVASARANELLLAWVSARKSEVGFTVNEDLLRRVELPEPEWKKSVARESRVEDEGGS
jgi:parvulin-like peptidyl-prolyl isomerase